jgi:hypothetical protein
LTQAEPRRLRGVVSLVALELATLEKRGNPDIYARAYRDRPALPGDRSNLRIVGVYGGIRWARFWRGLGAEDLSTKE